MKMNVPNRLTVIRLLLVPVFLVFVLGFGGETWGMIAAICVFAIASFTDFLDGKIARKYHLITDFGKFLDPLADKFLVLAALASLSYKAAINAGDSKASDVKICSVLFFCTFMIVLLRELAVTSMRLVVASSPDKKVVAASWLGKIKTCTQMFFILAAMAEPLIWDGHIVTYIFMAAAAVMTVWSGMSYIVGYWKYLDPSK